MAKKIKITSKGNIPSVNVDGMQIVSFSAATSEVAPYKISISAKCRAYGTAPDGTRVYETFYMPPVGLPDIDWYIANALQGAEQIQAAASMTKVIEGLGEFLSVVYAAEGISFTGVE